MIRRVCLFVCLIFFRGRGRKRGGGGGAQQTEKQNDLYILHHDVMRRVLLVGWFCFVLFLFVGGGGGVGEGGGGGGHSRSKKQSVKYILHQHDVVRRVCGRTSHIVISDH